jgi:hypothetical protein
VIFSQLYGAFPVERDLDPAAIARVLGASTSTDLPSGHLFDALADAVSGR